jgi:hypothetical protein
MELQFPWQRRRLAWSQGCDKWNETIRNARRQEGQGSSLTILKEFAAAKIDGTAFIPEPAQTEAPATFKRKCKLASSTQRVKVTCEAGLAFSEVRLGYRLKGEGRSAG